MNGSRCGLPTVGRFPWGQSWSPDGRFLVYSAFDSKTRFDLYLLPMSGGRTPIPLVRSERDDSQGQISPSGRWLAYTSDESGRSEVYVTSFPTPTVKWQISAGGAGDPRWRPDGAEFYFVADRQLMAVPVTDGTRFAHGEPVRLFDTGVTPAWQGARNTFDVGGDGRFLFLAPVEDDRSAPVTLVLNWTARLATP